MGNKAWVKFVSSYCCFFSGTSSVWVRLSLFSPLLVWDLALIAWLVNYPCSSVFHFQYVGAVILFPVLLVFVDLFLKSLWCNFSGVLGESSLIGICLIYQFNMEFLTFLFSLWKFFTVYFNKTAFHISQDLIRGDNMKWWQTEDAKREHKLVTFWEWVLFKGLRYIHFWTRSSTSRNLSQGNDSALNVIPVLLVIIKSPTIGGLIK